MALRTYLTSYDGLVCEECATHPAETLTVVTDEDLGGVYGYDSARCEECGTTVYDGLGHPAQPGAVV